MTQWPGQEPSPSSPQQRPRAPRAGSQPPVEQAEQAPAPTPWMPPNAQNTPNAEKYLLEADAMRRRQLRSAMLHGSRRTWREHKRVWPAVIAGVIVVAVILAAFTVASAVKEAKHEQDLEDQQSSSAPITPMTPTTSSAPAPTPRLSTVTTEAPSTTGTPSSR